MTCGLVLLQYSFLRYAKTTDLGRAKEDSAESDVGLALQIKIVLGSFRNVSGVQTS